MQKSAGYVIISALLIGAAAFWPIGLGQADETNVTVPQAQKQSVIVDNPINNTAPSGAGTNKSSPYVTRGEFAVKLVNSLGLNLDGYRFFKAPEVKDFFDDVPAGSPQANAIMILGYNGVIQTTDRSFRPSEMLLREEMAQILGNLLQQKARNRSEPAADQPQIKDLAAASTEAADDIKLVVGLNIMRLNREGSFQPKQGVTPQEMATILKEVKQRIGVSDSDVTAKIISGKEGGRVLEISWGEKPSSGYEIYIVDMKLDGHTLTVNYQTKEPTPGSYNSTVITEPKDTRPIPVNYPAQLNIQLNKL
ncbi:S-layer homology domain-containing protein [Desulforamulus putei]|uniref:S-layer homology domain-containing protein n=1 Tax=Desulforamulus putei TaxID=74701 RepID=UPI002FDC81AB